MDKIDYDYTNAPVFKKGRFLPFIIYEKPENFLGDKENEKKINDTFLKKYEISLKDIVEVDMQIYFGIFVVFSIFLPILDILQNHEFDFILILIYFCIGSPFLYVAYKKRKIFRSASSKFNYMKFDRLNSLLTMPKMNYIDYITIPFNDLKATRRAVARSKFTYFGKELHFFNDTRPWRPWRGDNYHVLKNHGGVYNRWSFYVWYMDKNRPLPPLPTFDKYRAKDFERRKAEGFPPPLFKSVIITPEATPEQQRERECFWKDQDFIVTNE